MPHIDLPQLPGIVGLLVQYPQTAGPLNALADALLRGPSSLSPADRETIAAYVSARNECTFCAETHGAAARHLHAAGPQAGGGRGAAAQPGDAGADAVQPGDAHAGGPHSGDALTAQAAKSRPGDALTAQAAEARRGDALTAQAAEARPGDARAAAGSRPGDARGAAAQRVADVIANGERADVGPKLQSLLVIAEKVRVDGRSVSAADVASAREAGADDKAIHDTVLIAAAFCMFNRYVDGLATVALDGPDDYAQHAKVLAEGGYLQDGPGTERLR